MNKDFVEVKLSEKRLKMLEAVQTDASVQQVLPQADKYLRRSREHYCSFCSRLLKNGY